MTLKGQGRDPNIFKARYFVQNSLGGYMHSLGAFYSYLLYCFSLLRWKFESLTIGHVYQQAVKEF